MRLCRRLRLSCRHTEEKIQIVVFYRDHIIRSVDDPASGDRSGTEERTHSIQDPRPWVHWVVPRASCLGPSLNSSTIVEPWQVVLIHRPTLTVPTPISRGSAQQLPGVRPGNAQSSHLSLLRRPTSPSAHPLWNAPVLVRVNLRAPQRRQT
jgi:hypothetical protein